MDASEAQPRNVLEENEAEGIQPVRVPVAAKALTLTNRSFESEESCAMA